VITKIDHVKTMLVRVLWFYSVNNKFCPLISVIIGIFCCIINR